MRTTPDLSTLTIVRRLARRVRRLEAEAESNGRGQQAALRAVHEGAFTVYDENDEERLKLGRQDDGSYGVKHKGGPAPSVPSVPIVHPILGGAMIQWDGFDADDEGYDEGEVAYVRVHLLVTADDEPDDDNLAGTVVSYAGGALTVAQDPDVTTWAVLVAVNKAGKTSDPSATAPVKARRLEWEWDDTHEVTDAEVAAQEFTHQLLHLPAGREFNAYLNGVWVHPDWYSIDGDTGIVTVSLPPAAAARDVADPDDQADYFAFHYAYSDDVPAPPPVRLAIVVPQAITDYTDDTGTYHGPGPLTGQALSVAQPHVVGFNGSYNFSWTLPPDFSTFAELGIVAIRIEGTFAGAGVIGFDWSLDNPGAPGAPQWPDGNDSGGHITLDSYWGDSTLPGSIHVAGPTTFEHEFAVNGTASDPYYEGFNYDDVLGKLEVSLHALASGVDGYDHVYGTIEGAGDGSENVQILSFNLILLGPAV